MLENIVLIIFLIIWSLFYAFAIVFLKKSQIKKSRKNAKQIKYKEQNKINFFKAILLLEPTKSSIYLRISNILVYFVCLVEILLYILILNDVYISNDILVGIWLLYTILTFINVRITAKELENY